jgi:hypothetical protein
MLDAMLRVGVIWLLVALVAVLATVAIAPSATASPTVTRYPNCKALNRRYPHGVGKIGAHDHTSGSPPVTNFKRSNALYQANRARDRDKDGIACEKA